MRVFVGCCSAVLLLGGLVSGQTPTVRLHSRSVSELQADQRSLIGQWCRLDYEGSRLSDAGWKKFEPIATPKHNPEFNSIYVVSRYQLIPPDKVGMTTDVSYMVIGRYDLGIGYTPAPGTRYVTYRFAEKDGTLEVEDIDPPQPNVSKPAMITWLKAQLATAKSPDEKMPIEKALSALSPTPAAGAAPGESSK